jgi:hypothetical protein
VDIDDLARKPMPAGRKERYRKLQERYGIRVNAWLSLTCTNRICFKKGGRDSSSPPSIYTGGTHAEPEKPAPGFFARA